MLFVLVGRDRGRFEVSGRVGCVHLDARGVPG